jgi:hypothetical protein
MLTWFVPVAGIILAVRYGVTNVILLRRLCTGMLVNAIVLASLGVAQFVSGTKSVYWVFPQLRNHFFAGFGYQNHAAAFFYLHFCVALGMCLRDLAQGVRGRRVAVERLPVVAMVLCAIAIHLSLSRGGMIMLWSTVVIAGTYAGLVVLKRLRPAARVNVVVGTAALGMMIYYATAAFAGNRMDDELKTLQPTQLQSAFTVRWWQVRSAVDMWKANPLFGVGGWGYRYLSWMHVPPSYGPLLKMEGKANVHNDPAQFLAEFGLVGAACFGLVITTLLWPVLKRTGHLSALSPFIVIGIGFVFLYSFFDLPFRCPAVLFTWTTMLAVVSRYETIRSSGT